MENITGIQLSDLNNWLLLVAALVVAMAIFYSLEKLAKALIVPIAIAAIVLIVAKVAFGISPAVLGHDVVILARKLLQRLAI